MLQKWHAPSKKKKFDHIPVKEMFLREKESQSNDTSVNFDALNKLSNYAPIFSVLNDERFDYEKVIFSKSIPLPAVALVDGVYINAHVPEMPITELIFFYQKVQKSLQECYEIERKTMKQNDDFWKKERFLRLTSSKFFDICRSTNKNKTSLLLLNPPDICNIPAVKHGINNERKAKLILAKMYKHLDFRNVGLVINPLFSYLGASPDGLFYGKDVMLVEIKTIFNKDKLTLPELCQKADFCLRDNGNGVYNLKETHKYYYQIQGQMAVCNLDNCLFSVFYDSEKEPFLQEIKFDKNLWQEIFEHLNKFYFNIHLKNIINTYSE